MQEERKRILEMVQEGKLSAQEAIVLLEALSEDLHVKSKDAKANFSHEEKSQEKETASEREPGAQQSANREHNDSLYSQLEHAGERIFDFVNSALNKIKNIDLQFNHSVDVPHTFQQADTGIERIDIDVANGPVRIVTWGEQEIRIECQAKVYRSDDREDARKYFLDHTIFSLENGLLCFATQSKWMKVETVIYVPKKEYKKISVRVFTGGLSGERLASDHFMLKTTNGKVELSHLEGGKLDVDTVNGQLSLTEVNAEELNAETVNGAIDVIGTFQSGKLQSFNGNINCTLLTENTTAFEAKAITGNIHIYVPDGATIHGDVRSNLGSYKLELEDMDVMHEKKEMIQKQVTFKRTGTSENVIHVLADTKAGSVLVGKAVKQGV